LRGLIELPGSVRRKRLTVLNTKTEHDRFVGLLGDLDGGPERLRRIKAQAGGQGRAADL